MTGEVNTIKAAGPAADDAAAQPLQHPRPVTLDLKVRLQALALPEADGGYSILVPALPGCVSQADTIEEAVANAVEAAEGWLAAGHEHNKDEDLRVARGES